MKRKGKKTLATFLADRKRTAEETPEGGVAEAVLEPAKRGQMRTGPSTFIFKGAYAPSEDQPASTVGRAKAQARKPPAEVAKPEVALTGLARHSGALPKLSTPEARRTRIAVWKFFRPAIRWHRRSSPASFLKNSPFPQRALRAAESFLRQCRLAARKRLRPLLRSRRLSPHVATLVRQSAHFWKEMRRASTDFSQQYRKARIAARRLLRKGSRWQHRSSPARVLATYFAIFGALSIAITAYFLLSAPKRNLPVKAAESLEKIPMQLGATVHKPLLEHVSEPPGTAQMQSQAEEEFRAGNYAAAELIFRKLVPTARFRALTGFQVFLCLIKQGKIEEAKQMATKFPYGPTAKNPSGIYASAAFALLEGRSADARQSLETARGQYPLISPLYDTILTDAKIAAAR